MSYLLGIDVATSATKALLVDEAGEVVAQASTEYSFETPRPLWSEQNPELWWNGAVQSIRQVLSDTNIAGKAVQGIGLTGQMHGLVALDEAGNVLRPAILWNDQRTGQQCDEIRRRLGKDKLIQLTGNNALAGFTAPKILWMRTHEPDLYDSISHILLPKDYLRYRLTGTYATDTAGAAGTLLVDLEERAWSEEVISALEIPRAWLPEMFEGPEVTGRISENAADVTGLSAGTPVVAGGGDQSAQAVGVGAVSEGTVALTLGTSGVVFAPTTSPVIEPDGRLHAFCHAVPNQWHLMGVMLSAAGSLRWYRDLFAPEVAYSELLEPAAEISPGADGLLFLPYLTGERTPHPDPLARGAFVGMTVRHTRAHMTRAVLEGVAFGLRDNFELIQEMGLPIDEIRLSGGGAQSSIWQQILADIFSTRLVTVNTTEGASYGAALLAGVGAKIWPDVETACSATITLTDQISPQSSIDDRYTSAYRQYRSLYPTLKQAFAELSTLEEP
jgi:xylulokinase